MKLTVATLNMHSDLRLPMQSAPEPFLSRVLRALVASHEFTLLMPESEEPAVIPERKYSLEPSTLLHRQ